MISDELRKIFEEDHDGLLETPEKQAKATSVDRLEQSFIEITDFYREHGRIPDSTTRNMSERRLGARLDGILSDDEKVEALRHLDEFALLDSLKAPASVDEALGGDSLGLLDDPTGLLDTSDLPARSARTEPDEVAQRIVCQDFDQFEPLFIQKHEELATGKSKLVKFPGTRYIKEGAFFVLAGVMVFVADVREKQLVNGKPKERLRCIFENGTESGMYRLSLATRLYEDDGYALVPSEFESVLADDEETGYIYVLRSESDDPQISSVKNLYKIGFSRGSVEKRIAAAEREPTYLMAPVEIVATYRTYNLKTQALEHLLHRVFSDVRLQVEQAGKEGRTYEPSEWYVVPLEAISHAAELIASGEIVDFIYDQQMGRLVPRNTDGAS